MKKGNANMTFEKRQRPAYRSRRSPQLTPRFPQAPLLEGGDEDLHGLNSVHFPTVLKLISEERRQSSGTRQWPGGMIGFDRDICTNCRSALRRWLLNSKTRNEYGDRPEGSPSKRPRSPCRGERSEAIYLQIGGGAMPSFSTRSTRASKTPPLV